jgi:twitching motility protein PilI
MAKKTSLRDFQEYLAARLTTAAQGRAPHRGWVSRPGARLGCSIFLIAARSYQAPQLTPVPLTRAWFAGIANIRGNLHAVTDFSVFRAVGRRRRMPMPACC